MKSRVSAPFPSKLSLADARNPNRSEARILGFFLFTDRNICGKIDLVSRE